MLISLDTTRADALSCYGGFEPLDSDPGVVTPNLDALAAGGTRFEEAWAHAPTTLSSHASMFTGLDPHRHTVVRNGYALPDGIASLPERLQAQGYDTLGVIGAAALADGMGLERGFRIYDGEMRDKFGPMVQDRADRVLARTLEALDQREEDKPLFLFTHFYDAHGPFDAPGEHMNRFVDPSYTGPYAEEDYQLRPVKEALRAGTADPADVQAVNARYLGEVAYVDHHVGLLIEALDERGLLDHTLIIVTADHGEGMDERPLFAWSHGYGTHREALRVPLIVRGPQIPAGRVVHSQVGLSGLAPTVERLLGLDPSLGERRDFADTLAMGPVRDADGWPDRPTSTIFGEATRTSAGDHPAWNNLHLMRTVRAGGYVGWAWPLQGRTPVALGPPAANTPLEPTLTGLLQRWDAMAPPHREEEMTLATREALKALGYLED